MITELRDISRPYLIFLGDIVDPLDAKIATGLKHWRFDDCFGQVRLTSEALDVGLPSHTLESARKSGVRTAILGGSPAGGRLPESWIEFAADALTLGFDVVSGLHDRLTDQPRLKGLAETFGRRLIDIRHSDARFPIGSPRRRNGRRILTVGTDTCVGKKFTALSMTEAMRRTGYDVSFRATGQTGLLISGGGIVIDGVASDFVSGAVEVLSPSADIDHWDVIEGQGSLLHPSHAAVTLGLVHGAQPDYLILCHVAGTQSLVDWPEISIPSLNNYADLYLEAAYLTNPEARVLGLSINTSALQTDKVDTVLQKISDDTGYVTVDPIAKGVSGLVELLPKPGRN